MFILKLIPLLLLPATLGQAEPVSLCELGKRSTYWAGKHVRVTALHFDHAIRDPECYGRDFSALLVCDHSEGPEFCSKTRRLLARDPGGRSGANRSEVTLEGRIVSWNGSGYGHLGGYRHLFEYDLVLELKPNREDPQQLPEWNSYPSPFMDSVRALQLAEQLLITSLINSNTVELPEVLQSEFELLLPGDRSESSTKYFGAKRGFCSGPFWVKHSGSYHSAGLGFAHGAFGCGDDGQESSGPMWSYSSFFRRQGQAWVPEIVAIKESQIASSPAGTVE